jgi:hypothetical protein
MKLYVSRREDEAGVKKINSKVVVVWMEIAFQLFVLIS